MPLELIGRVGPGNKDDNEDAVARLTNERALVMQLLHGTHAEQALRGRVFSQACTPLGLALPLYTATAIGSSAIGAMPIWNPPQSKVNVVLLFADIAYASGTAGFGAVGVMARKLTAIATGEVCTALADTTPINGLLFGGQTSQVKSSNAGTVTVTAGVVGDWVRSIASINLEAQTGTAHGTGIAHYDFKGTMVVPPGVLVYLACTVATVALYASAIVWEEVALT